jgi:hypothetical protein
MCVPEKTQARIPCSSMDTPDFFKCPLKALTLIQNVCYMFLTSTFWT